MLRVGVFLILVSIMAGNSSAQDKTASRVLSRYDVIRPDDRELAMYRLDWASSLDEALQRATDEGRPVFLLIIHAKYGDIASGHC